MKNITTVYKAWQPTLAAYSGWTDERKRKEQAIREMVAEAGEVEGVVAKAARKGIAIPRDQIVDELGDTLWGLVGVMNEFDISWYELMQGNMDKLNKRYKNA